MSGQRSEWIPLSQSWKDRKARRHRAHGNLGRPFPCTQSWPDGDPCIASYLSENGLAQHLSNDHGVRGAHRIRNLDVSHNAEVSEKILRLRGRVVRGGNIDSNAFVAMIVGSK